MSEISECVVRIQKRSNLRKLLSISVLLCFATVLAVAPVRADVKVYDSKVIRDYSYIPAVSTPYGVFDIEQYSTMFITVWSTEDGGSRVLTTSLGNVKFLQSGEVVGQGTSRSVVNMIVPEWPFTLVNQLNILVTLRGSGQVANYHLTMIYLQGQLIVFHEVGVP